MKTTITTLFFFLFNPFLFNATSQIYVNHAATGDNDGSSWEDAYLDLQSALAAAPNEGTIWVAQVTIRRQPLKLHKM